MSPWWVGSQPRSSRVSAFEAGASASKKRASQLKCSSACSAGTDTTGTSRPRPIASAMTRVGTPAHDQGPEHGPRDFFANPPASDPRYILRLAKEGGFNGIILQIGGLGVAMALVRHILATALELNLAAACKAVVVTAIDEPAASWWQRYGFVPFDGDGLDL
jgi:hypothetical protein